LADSSVAPPTANWSPGDFLSAAQAVTQSTSAHPTYGYVPYSGVLPDLLYFMHALDQDLFVLEGDRLRPRFAEPALRSAIQWYLDLDRVHHVSPPFEELLLANGGASEKAQSLVQTGQAALWFGGGYQMRTDSELQALEGMLPLPYGGSGLHTSNFTQATLHISKQTTMADACWRWIDLLLKDEMFLVGPGMISSRTTQFERAVSLAGVPAKEATLLYEYAAILESDPPIRGMPEEELQSAYIQWFAQAIHRVILERADLGQTLDIAQSITELFISCMEKEHNQEQCEQQALIPLR
jgi:ABC-type glycerol-3-phosphate transport system substrate-binding protein